MAVTATPRYRWDLLAALLAPVAAVAAAAALLGAPLAGATGAQLALAGPILLLILLEAVTLREAAGAARDRGIVSGLLTGSALVIPAADRLLLQLCQFPAGAAPWGYGLGLLLLAAGGALRWLAKRHLGRHFSHSLRLLPGHELIVSGPYRLVRHPAYLGTVLIGVGMSLLFNSWAGLVIIALLAPLALARIRGEERLLAARFGVAYAEYSRRVGRLLPFRF